MSPEPPGLAGTGSPSSHWQLTGRRGLLTAHRAGKNMVRSDWLYSEPLDINPNSHPGLPITQVPSQTSGIISPYTRTPAWYPVTFSFCLVSSEMLPLGESRVGVGGVTVISGGNLVVAEGITNFGMLDRRRDLALLDSVLP